MKGTAIITIAILLLALGLVTYRVWSVGQASELWRAGDWWTVRVEHVQAFLAQPAPPWTEANVLRFEVLGTTPRLGGPQVQLRVTFAQPVLDGFSRLELTYDGRTLAPLNGRLLGDGRTPLDWATARPLLEASLFPFDGLDWRRPTPETQSYNAAGRQWTAYRVLRAGREYGWSEDAPWWLWYSAGDQVRAALVDCSSWQSQEGALPPVGPALEAPAPAVTPQPALTLRYDVVLQTREAGAWTAVAQRSGELLLERGLGTGVVTLAWGSPERKMHLYLSLLDSPSPRVRLDKVVITAPAQASFTPNVEAPFADGQASLEFELMVGKALHLLRITLR